MTEYRNPQDDPGSQKRLMLAFFLVFVMIAAMQFFLKPPAPKPGEQQQNAKQQPAQSTPTAPPLPTTTPARSTARRAAPASVPKAQVKQASAETQTVLENDLYRITFTNHGGMVKSWILKKYKNDKGQPLDLVNETTAPTLGFPLSLFAYDKDLEKKLNDALYQTNEGPQKDTVTFEYSDGDLLARKVFHAEGNSYLISMETEVTRDGQPVTAYP
ncbi:MAG TPA: membrane protein insertase YidC, partial [Candidatus Angelobacter sp.]|nr:membrane protein insertase YidC [Candidatus Angelobacter sp.]